MTFTVTNADKAVFIILSNSTAVNDADSIPKIGKCRKHMNYTSSKLFQSKYVPTCLIVYRLLSTYQRVYLAYVYAVEK